MTLAFIDQAVLRWRGNFAAACRRGYDAGIAGKPPTACPYDDVRGARGHVTFSRAYRKAWFEGWTIAVEEVGASPPSWGWA